MDSFRSRKGTPRQLKLKDRPRLGGMVQRLDSRKLANHDKMPGQRDR